MKRNPRSSLLKDAAFLAGTATFTLLVGLFTNQVRNRPLPLLYQEKAQRLELAVSRIEEMPQPSVSSAPLGLPVVLSLAEFQAFVQERRGLVLDARPEIFHRIGHVPGALSLPREDFEASYRRLRGQLETNKKQRLVAYCSSAGCEDSEMVHQALVKLGYTNVAVFRGGWEEWTRAALPEEMAK